MPHIGQRTTTHVSRRQAQHDLLQRIGVQPPYFALRDLSLEGLYLSATAQAESPPFREHGPMPAAELGRHAAITGLCHAASAQPDDRRRYYLARHAECRYQPNEAPYGTPVRFSSELLETSKRACTASVTATAADAALASFRIEYTILTESAFQRLFRHRALTTPAGPNPYEALLTSCWTRDGDGAEQVVKEIPASACAGHFGGYPALPVAVLMGQLSYLAGRLYGDPPQPYRVVRGEVSASDLAWAGEAVRFRADPEPPRSEEDEATGDRYACEAIAGDRRVGGMTLWLTSVD
ncbi:MAG: hypothetical protein U5K81_15870 [Trueperaceae bacterium]|nr:hypothetical protein [Trueperaceae bacterium]